MIANFYYIIFKGEKLKSFKTETTTVSIRSNIYATDIMRET